MEAVDLVDGGAELEDVEQQLAAVEREMHQVEAQIERLLARQAALQGKQAQLQRIVAAHQRAPRADWQGQFSWDARVQQLLAGVFGLSSWRPLQREVINAALQGRDVLCLMPSGGGKSLCYQLPALVGDRGLTLVVSPLLSLIQDQVLGLAELGVKAAALTSVTGKEEAAAINKQVDDAGSGLRLLYCTPEKLVNSKRFFAKLEKVYKAGRLQLVAIDEVHCASQWGNDFRPDYKKLGIIKQQFPDTPVIALTATATQAVCDDVRSILRIDGCELFRSSINRPNLFYEVVPKPSSSADLAADIAAWVSSNYPGGDSGIVYVLTRKDAEMVAEELRGAGISCQAYHADLEPSWRESVHLQWSQGKLQVVVATIAFGMGINNPHVRFVIHHTISKSTANYYQEAGRAGRDGLPAHCRMYYRFSDYLRQAAVVTMESNWEPHLKCMMQYAAGHSSCRRAMLCRHFGEAPPPCPGMCDVCRFNKGLDDVAAVLRGDSGTPPAPVEPLPVIEASEAARGVVQTLQAWPGQEQRATLIQLIDKWRGSKDAGVSRAAKALTREQAEAVVQRLVLEGVLQLDFGFTAYSTNTYLKASPRALAQLQACSPLTITLPPSPEANPWAGCAVKPQPGQVAQQQRQWREQLAQRQQPDQWQQQAQPPQQQQQQRPAPPQGQQQEQRGQQQQQQGRQQQQRQQQGQQQQGRQQQAQQHREVEVVVLDSDDSADEDFIQARPAAKRGKR